MGGKWLGGARLGLLRGEPLQGQGEFVQTADRGGILVHSLSPMESLALCVGTCLLTHSFLHLGFEVPSTFSVLGKQHAYRAPGVQCVAQTFLLQRLPVGGTDRSFPTGTCLNNRR